ncbi:diacylglycerol kinase [Marinospirillum insulare]|uniref:Diacylglycerol kinase n=1 Tax=Marinospirillum insulare TaxID=217169 RepID=A0ABQ5ZXF5_9GAMM|nr:diacylglycerol kinase [Marinospirillum insulare]GLR63331.1 diacylglycerol kinase [Marinospirillum insulare]
MKPGATGIRRIINASYYSWLGLKAAWKSEAALRQEIVALIILLPLAFLMPLSPIEKALLAFSGLLVLLVELINSALEAVVDRIGPEQHPLSGKAKDIGSTAVALALIMCALVWGIILLPLLTAQLSS